MKPEKIRAVLIEKKVKQIEIAREFGVTSGAISRVIDGHFKSRRIQQAISEKAHIPFEKMWRKAA